MAVYSLDCRVRSDDERIVPAFGYMYAREQRAALGESEKGVACVYQPKGPNISRSDPAGERRCDCGE